MPVTGLSFAAQVDDFVRETDQRMTAVFRESSGEVIREMQKPGPNSKGAPGEGGNMPVDLGFLQSSLVVALNAEPAPAIREADGQKHTWAPAAADLVIAGAEIGDTIVASYTAVYAPVIEYGGDNRVPRRFVGSAAAMWQTIVQRVTARLKTRISGRSAPPSP